MYGYQLDDFEDEVTNLLSQLIKINTTNPPGNEIDAAKFVQASLEKDGFHCEIIESLPKRGNLLTRLKGTGEKPSLLLLSHLDVVAADAKEWSVNPFSGVIRDGFVWGRGALDMKGMTAIELMTLKLLKRNNIKLKGDVILAATADEEMGGSNGVDFLLKNYPDKIFAPYVINEGGGWAIPLKNKNIYTIQTAEKGLLWFKIKAKGVPGHGSMPNIADNAILRINNVINRLVNNQVNPSFSSTIKQFISEISKDDDKLQKAVLPLLSDPEKSDMLLKILSINFPGIADEILPRIKMTITPTVINGGTKENIVPSECEAVFDCRLLPEQTIAQVKALIKQILAPVGLENLTIQTIQAQEPSSSTPNSSLYNAMSNVLREIEPECGITPMLMTGGTDSRFFRRMGSVCYGFHPMRSETSHGVKVTRREHGIDERISIDNLVFGTSVLYKTIKTFLS